MNLPFCEQCAAAKSCVPDLALNKAETGNMRVPPESFCRARHAEAGVDTGDFYKNVLANAVENPTCLYPVYPELQKQVSTLESEWHSKNPQAQQGFTPFSQLPLSVTLMLTEKCNLACAYCYERFSGNVQPKSMPREVIWQTVQKYLTRETLALHPRIQWDLIGGKVFAEFDLLKYAVDCILKGYKLWLRVHLHRRLQDGLHLVHRNLHRHLHQLYRHLLRVHQLYRNLHGPLYQLYQLLWNLYRQLR